MGKKNQKQDKLDMREYIQSHLDLWDLGKMVAVVGPERGGRENNQSWYQLVIKYRPNVGGHHFDDKRIEVYLGLTRHGGYLNRRSIRLAIEKEGRAHRSDIKTEQIWASSQKALTSGSGPIAL